MAEGARPEGREGSVAGAGAGTGYLGLLSLIPADYHWLRDMLVFAAPVLTVAFGFLWVVLSSFVSRKVLEMELDAAVSRATKIRDEILSDGMATNTDKKNARDSVAALKKLQMDAVHQGVADVRARLKTIAVD